MKKITRFKKVFPTLPLLLLLGISLLAAGCFGATREPTLEQQASAIDKKLICPVCPGETIDQSQVEIAAQMRAIVREKLAQGESEASILKFFEERYGPSVLAEPPKQGFNVTVWIVPIVVFLLAAGVLSLVVREMRKGKLETAPPQEQTPQEKELERYLSEVDKERKTLE